MHERMTWDEIVRKYPDQWVGLTDVERDGASVKTAVVKYADKTSDELYDMQLSGQGVYTIYTTPETFPYGQVMIWVGDET